MALFGVNVMSPLGSGDFQSTSGSSGAIDIEKEASFVDLIILKVGTSDDLIRIYAKNFSKEYWLFIEKQKLRLKASVLLTEADRVDFAQKHFTGIFLPSEILKKYQKNGETSRLLRDHGNYLYRQKNFEVALHYYNLALVFAETETEAAGMAYANRSAVLVELGCFKDALQDVEYALKNKYPTSKSPKLEQRRTKCTESILRKKQEYEALEPKLRFEIEEEMKTMKEMQEEMLRVKNPNALIPVAAESVEIKFDESQGRHLVVNEDVPPGTVLAVENPYVFTLEHHSKWNLGHCHHCLKRIRRGIPCPSCVFAIYCDESCQSKADIHQFECKCLPSLHASCAADQVFMAARIILKVGPKELFRLFEAKDPSYFNPKHPYGTEPDSKYESQSYLSIFHFATNSDKLPLAKRVGTAGRAVMATEIVDRQTSFFEDIPQDSKIEFKKFVAGLMLRHIEATRLNAVYLMDLQGLEHVNFVDIYTRKISPQRAPDLSNPEFGQFAGALYSVFGLLNHSCDPNVQHVNHTTNGSMAVVATRSLKKGEKLLTSYISGFADTPISIRQAKLQENYFFECNCIACEQKWPTQINVYRQIPRFCCPICSATFFGYEKASREFRKCVLDAPRWKCGRCGQLFNAAELTEICRNNMELTVTIPQLLQLGRPRMAFDEYVKLIEYFQHHVCPPSLQLSFIQDQLIKALSLIFYFSE